MSSTTTKISDARLAELIALGHWRPELEAIFLELQSYRDKIIIRSLPTALLLGDANVMALTSLGSITHALSGQELEITPLVLRHWEGEESSLRLTLGFTDIGADIAPEDRRTALLNLDGILDLAVQKLEVLELHS